jgi:Tfp pilus assembly protein PilF
MLTTTLLFAVVTAMSTPATPSNPDVLLPIRGAARTISALTAANTDEPDALRRALAAQAVGDMETARREYVVAAALDRDAGALPTQASYGLALVLSEQGKYQAAARVMEQLAADAATLRDDDVEARALVDALFLNGRAHLVAQARDNADRLRELSKSPKLSTDTRKRIAAI